MDKTKEEQSTEFESILEELRKQLLDACVHFDIWVETFPTEQVVDVMNQYKGFFIPTRIAHLDRLFIKISNIFSNHPKAPSFYRVLNMISKNAELASIINPQEIRNRLNKHKEVRDGIRRYRNKRAAHWDTEPFERRKPVLFGKTKIMLEELQNIFNEISGAHSGKQWSFKYMQHYDTSRLLNNLKQL